MKRGSQDLEPPRVPPESGWAMEWSRAVSRAREGPASKVTATQLDTAVSLVHATQAGRELCVTSKLATPVMATSECFCASSKTTASAMALKERPRVSVQFFTFCISLFHPTGVSMVPASQSTPIPTPAAASLALLVSSVMSRTRMQLTPAACLAANMANVECQAWARRTASVTADIQERRVTEVSETRMPVRYTTLILLKITI